MNGIYPIGAITQEAHTAPCCNRRRAMCGHPTLVERPGSGPAWPTALACAIARSDSTVLSVIVVARYDLADLPHTLATAVRGRRLPRPEGVSRIACIPMVHRPKTRACMLGYGRRKASISEPSWHAIGFASLLRPCYLQHCMDGRHRCRHLKCCCMDAKTYRP